MSKTKLLLGSVSVALSLALSGCAVSSTGEASKSIELSKGNTILESYSKIAYNNYLDALNDAKALEEKIKEFSANPSPAGLEVVKLAWLKSRESYGQTEAFRLSNGPIDAEDGWVADTYGALEGQINAWPLDENMIDYTIDAEGKKTSGNIIDTIGEFNPGGEDASTIDVTNISVDAITSLNENGGEANVATGYHAIEFILWGQDQDYSNFVKDAVTNGAMTAGRRPFSDFVSDDNASRRLAYLQAASKKLVNDLETVTKAWGENGLYQKALNSKLTGTQASKNISKDEALKQIIAGLGVFMKSELANERIAVAVLTPSEEDEHSCFSDNTHRDIVTNYQGFKNILTSTYKGVSYGPSLLDKVSNSDKKRIIELMASIEEKIAKIDLIANTSAHFDYQIQPDNPQARVIVKLKNEMRKLGDEMVNVANANGISLTTDDVTDAEETQI